MAATSFGGSRNLVASEDTRFRSLLWSRLTQSAIHSQLPWLKYLPFVPVQSTELDDMIDKTVAQRRRDKEEGKEIKRDLVQIVIENHDADPENYTIKHLRQEIGLFMYVRVARSLSTFKTL